MFNVKEFVTSAIKSKDAWTGPDKWLHLAGGFAIALAVSVIFPQIPYLGLGIAIAMSLGKEMWDHVTPGHNASYKDFVMSVVGAVLGYGLYRIVI